MKSKDPFDKIIRDLNTVKHGLIQDSYEYRDGSVELWVIERKLVTISTAMHIVESHRPKKVRRKK